jgi:thioredoxin-like negative regulator of GroEL
LRYKTVVLNLPTAAAATGAATVCARGAAAIEEAGSFDGARRAGGIRAAEALLAVGHVEEGIAAALGALAAAKGKGDAAAADAAKTLALAAFDALGNSNPHVIEGRKKLSKALFR